MRVHRHEDGIDDNKKRNHEIETLSPHLPREWNVSVSVGISMSNCIRISISIVISISIRFGMSNCIRIRIRIAISISITYTHITCRVREM